MKNFIRNFILDLKSETPKVWAWICGALVSIAVASGVMIAVYSGLPDDIKTLISPLFLKILGYASIIGSLIAKKQNVK